MTTTSAGTGPGPVRERLTSLDAFRGFDILTMVFVNYIAGMTAIPFFLRHAAADQDVFTLTDVVFPGFLFIVGVSIPLALTKRISAGDSGSRPVGHVLIRSAALLLLGVIEVNTERFSAADAGMSEALWSFLVLTAVSVLSLALFVIVELYFAEHPIVDLRAFRNISFGTGNVVMFIAFFNLFGSIVLLPLFGQILLGYTAFLAGLVLSPGGVATLLTMPIVGKLIIRRNPKYLLTFGIAVCALSTWLMSRFSLGADFSSLMWPRIYLGIGMGFLFIPLTTLTLSSIPRPQMGNATSIYNLLRNLGGSFGVAFATTMFARRAQLHQSHLTEHLTVFDRGFTDYEWWQELITNGILFVTRLKENALVEYFKKRPGRKTKGVVLDQEIRLKGMKDNCGSSSSSPTTATTHRATQISIPQIQSQYRQIAVF